METRTPTGFEIACGLAVFADGIFESNYRRRYPNASDEAVQQAI